MSPTGQTRPGAVPRHLGDEGRAAGTVRLPEIVLGHPPPARLEHAADARAHVGIAFERDAHHRGERLARDVVLRRPEAAARDHRVAARKADADALDHALEVVADLGLKMRVDADERQLLADPARIGVDDLAEQQLGADRDDFAAHDASRATFAGAL